MLIALDVETGGLDAATSPLMQVSLWNPDCEFEMQVLADPEMRIHPRALQANGLNSLEGLPPREVGHALLKWWKELPGSPQLQLVGHNVGPFDVPFLKQLQKHVDLPWGMMFDYHYRDTATLALALQDAGILHFGKWSLTNVCQVLGILYDPHTARADAKASWFAWQRMQAVLRMGPEELLKDILRPVVDLRGN